jgi:hypothetical protein
MTVMRSISIAQGLLLLLLATWTATADRAFKLGIRDSFMIAHSFHQHPAFGPAGQMHGAT